jgi:hypothetical protein
LQDPEAEVRKSLTECLVVLARKFPSAYAHQLSATKPEVVAGLIEGAEKAGEVGVRIAEQAFHGGDSRENAVRLFFRLGEKGKEGLLRLLESKDREVSLRAAEVLSQMPPMSRKSSLSRTLFALYQRCPDPESKGRVLGALSVYPPAEAKSLFEATLADPKAPPGVRSACASALVRLGEEESLWRVMTQSDALLALQETSFSRGIGIAFAEDEKNGVRRVLQSPLEAQFKTALLAWNRSPEAEEALVSLAKEGVSLAFIALTGRQPLKRTTLTFLYQILGDEKAEPRLRWLSARCLASTPEGQEWLRAIPPEEEGFWVARVALDEVTPLAPRTR